MEFKPVWERCVYTNMSYQVDDNVILLTAFQRTITIANKADITKFIRDNWMKIEIKNIPHFCEFMAKVGFVLGLECK